MPDIIFQRSLGGSPGRWTGRWRRRAPAHQDLGGGGNLNRSEIDDVTMPLYNNHKVNHSTDFNLFYELYILLHT